MSEQRGTDTEATTGPATDENEGVNPSRPPAEGGRHEVNEAVEENDPEQRS